VADGNAGWRKLPFAFALANHKMVCACLSDCFTRIDIAIITPVMCNLLLPGCSGGCSGPQWGACFFRFDHGLKARRIWTLATGSSCHPHARRTKLRTSSLRERPHFFFPATSSCPAALP